jgi:acetylornithine deacetylase
MTTLPESLAALLVEEDKTLRGRFSIKRSGIANDAYLTPEEAPLVAAMQRARRKASLPDEQVYAWNVSCDARTYAKAGRIPTIVFGCGELRYAHAPDERICLEDLLGAMRVLVEFLADDVM